MPPRFDRFLPRLHRPPASPLHVLIARANAANAARNWPQAEADYAAALKLDPDHHAVWVQYGHSLKEQGLLQEAEQAYRRACALAPTDADPPLQLGHVLKLQGRRSEAVDAYRLAFRLDPRSFDSLIELVGQGAVLSPLWPLWFDGAWYLTQYPQAAATRLDPFDYYARHGQADGHVPNSIVAAWGVTLHPPLRMAETEVIRQTETIADSQLLDSQWYSGRYGVPAEGAARHYVEAGAFLGADPNPFFSSAYYFKQNPDVAAQGLNPLVHCITSGFYAGRAFGDGSSSRRLTARVWERGF
jgi:tetratricopeptide (TPR) repeat protein